MSQHFGDLREGCALTDHLCGEAVTQQMGRSAARPLDSCAGKSQAHDAADCRRSSQSAAGSYLPQKNPSRCAGAAILTEVQGQRFANLRKQWQALQTLTFAVYGDLAGSPMEIVKFK
jgi:hypothetical protein